tara:strand:+ start:3459 stop:3941 length:483 start_codon:yes stop_codon:yes gene_type:complete
MIGEIGLLIKGLDTACKLVRAGLDRKKDIEAMGSEISSFFASKEEVEAKIEEVKRNQGGYAGSALEEAIHIEQQAQKIDDMMSRIGKEYSRQGKSHKWAKVKKDAANIQKNRDFAMANANRKKIIQDRKNEDFYLIVKLVVGLVILMIGLTGLVFTLAIN